MRRVTLVLIASGTALVLGSAVAFSFVAPARTETMRGPGDSTLIVIKTVWGRPLWATTFRQYEDTATTPPTAMESFESGPYPGGIRQDQWTMKTRRMSDPGWTEKTVWYLHGREVSEHEWDSR